LNAEVIERKVQLLIAEYNFVSGLITFYRSVELRALGGTGLMLTAIAAAVAAFEAADEPNREAESLLLAIPAWIPVVLVLIAIVALSRSASCRWPSWRGRVGGRLRRRGVKPAQPLINQNALAKR
jgi:hypothetical protein